MRITPLLSCLGLFLLSLPSNAELGEYSLEPGADGKPMGWRLHNARVEIFDGGEKRGVLLPDSNPGEFAKLCHREEFAPGSIESVKVTALIRATGGAQTGEAGRLRIFFSKPGGEFRSDALVWPAGRAGSYTPVLTRDDGWQEVVYELAAPLSAGEWEVAVESMDSERSVEVANIEIEKKAFSAKVNEIGPEDRKNLFAGTSTLFEGGLAGWQAFILPHWPAVQLAPEFITANPGEGRTSLKLAPGTGLNSMPVSSASGYDILSFSVLARASAEAKLVARIGQSDGQFQDEVFSIGPNWQRFTAHFRLPANRGLPYIFLENRGDGLGHGADIFIDAVSLIPGVTEDYIAPPEELILTSGPSKTVQAQLLLSTQDAKPGEWTWFLEDVLPSVKMLDSGKVDWTKTDEGRFSAEIAVPESQGLYRVVVRREGDESPLAPAEEVLVARDAFKDLPPLGGGPLPVEIGGEAHHNWIILPNAPWQKDIHPNWAGQLAKVRQAGVSWLRTYGGRQDPLMLAFIYPNSFDEKPRVFPEMLEVYREAGFKLFGVIDLGFSRISMGKPWFETRETHGEWMKDKVPTDMKVWERFVRTAAEAYKGSFDAWEVVNEPNGRMQAADYVPLLAAAYPILKEVAPEIPVYGICSTADFGSEIRGFVEESLELGAGKVLDGISYHPYVGSGTPEQSFTIMESMAKIVEKAGLADKPMCISEVGWTTLPAYVSHALRAPAPQASPRSALLGAAYTTRNILNAARVGDTPYFIWTAFSPFFAWHGATSFNPLFEYDGTPSPLFFTLGTLSRVLQGAKFAEAITLRNEGVVACLFEREGAGTIVGVWTDETVEPLPLKAVLPSPADHGWDGIGRPLGENLAAPLIGPLPTYLVFKQATPKDVAKLIAGAEWRASPSVSLRSAPAVGQDAFVVVAENPGGEEFFVEWKADGGDRKVISTPEGSSIVAESAARDGRTNLQGLLKTGATSYMRVDQDNPVLHAVVDAAEDFAPDGKLDHWSEVNPLVLDSDSFVSAGALPPGALEKSPVRLWIRPQTDGLAIAFDVPKPSEGFKQTTVGAEQGNMDSVEIFLRTLPHEVNWSGGSYQRGDIKLCLAQDSTQADRQLLRVDRGGNSIRADLVKFAFADRKGGPGYTGEVFIPWEALTDLTTTPPALLGLDISFNLASPAVGRQAQVTWASTNGGNWLDLKSVGVLRVKQP
jgi:hypothetical protein